MPSSDDFLRTHKFPHDDNALVLPIAARSHLWTSDPRFPPWAVVVDENAKERNNTLGHIKETASSLGFRIRYWSRRDQKSCPTLNSKSPGLEGYLDNILVYKNKSVFGNADPLKPWVRQKAAWTALPGQRAGRQRNQTAISSRETLIRGYLRLVFAPEETEYPIRSTRIRDMSVKSSAANLPDHEILCDRVLSWSKLLEDPTWRAWHKELRENMTSDNDDDGWPPGEGVGGSGYSF
ncbi:hypothetical protein OQA88_1141 [Cercophora sp. LCS_1]